MAQCFLSWRQRITAFILMVCLQRILLWEIIVTASHINM